MVFLNIMSRNEMKKVKGGGYTTCDCVNELGRIDGSTACEEGTNTNDCCAAQWEDSKAINCTVSTGQST